MFYMPRLSNNKLAPLPWQVRLFRGSVAWPLEYDANENAHRLDKIKIFFGYIMIAMMYDSEIRFMKFHIKDMGLVLECFVTFIVMVECSLRVTSMILNKSSFRDFLNDFYSNIYIESTSNPQMHAEIERKMVPTKVCSYSYMLTFLTYVAVPLISLIGDRRLLPFCTKFPYDSRPLYAYIPSVGLGLWVGFMVISQLAGEALMMATLILHLNARYLMLQNDLVELHAKLRKDFSRHPDYVNIYRTHLIAIIERNVKLNAFAEKLQEQYSFRVFIMMCMSSLLLCALGFKVATLGFVTANITYVLWIIGKVIELLIFGEIGSTLIHTTDQLSTMYYFSNWEEAILNSSNAKENVKLMKLITLAISLNGKPFGLNGLGFFRVSLEAVILQCASSYFTCLYAFH